MTFSTEKDRILISLILADNDPLKYNQKSPDTDPQGLLGTRARLIYLSVDIISVSTYMLSDTRRCENFIFTDQYMYLFFIFLIHF